MKNLLFATFALLFLFSSCTDKNKDDNSEVLTPCSIQDPLENIAWLKQVHFTFQAAANPLPTKIVQYTYQGECVFFIDSCVNCPDAGQTVYNEMEDIICEFGTIAGLNTCPNFFDEATDEVVLWGD